jgi:hypothetical protein
MSGEGTCVCCNGVFGYGYGNENMPGPGCNRIEVLQLQQMSDEWGGDMRLLQRCFWIWIWKREHASLRSRLQQDRSTTIRVGVARCLGL